jgi:hypothetical protein
MGDSAEIRIYEAQSSSSFEGTDRMIEAIRLGVEKGCHVKDIVNGNRHR